MRVWRPKFLIEVARFTSRPAITDRIAGTEGGYRQIFGLRLAHVENDDLGRIGQCGAAAAEFGQCRLAQFGRPSYTLQIGEEIYFMLGYSRILPLGLGNKLFDCRQGAGQIGRGLGGLKGLDFAENFRVFQGRLADHHPGRRGH